MDFATTFKDKIFNTDSTHFAELALELFRHQAANVPIYTAYLQSISCQPNAVKHLEDIRFLPISFFKTHAINSANNFSFYFQSSGTTAVERSKHYVSDLMFYKKNAKHTFEQQYGLLKDFVVLALLPSYQDNPFSSLIYMVDDFMKQTGDDTSSYFQPRQAHEIEQAIIISQQRNKKILLIGVTYALLDLAAEVNWQHYPNLIVMETGGMKGRREELTRIEVHQALKLKLGVTSIHSEYGMTELLSQAYAKVDGNFECPPTMRVMTRELTDPFSWQKVGNTGGINIIDLANIDSCAFIETQDLGKLNNDSTFSVLGRIDHSEIRGCNLMIQ